MRRALFAVLIVAAYPALAQRLRAVRPPVECSSAALAHVPSGAVTIDGGFVYYGDAELLGVYRLPKSFAGTPLLLTSLPQGQVTMIALDAQNVYVTVGRARFLQDLYSVSKRGGGARLLVESISIPKGIAVDEQYVYWSSYGTVVNDPFVASDGKIERIGKDGSNRTLLASGLSGAGGIAIDDTWVYFSENGLAIGNSSAGARRVPKEGGSVQHLYEKPVDTLVLAGNDLYVLDEDFDHGRDTITQMAKSGGPAKHTLSDSLISSPLVVYGGRIYYYTQSSGGKGIASTTLDLQVRTVHFGRSAINSSQFGVDDCAFYIATVTPDDFLLERIRR